MESTANLIDDPRATVALISNPLSWRVRVVEAITIDAATSCRRRRSLQAAPLRALLAESIDIPGDSTHALVALNVAPMPRGPLLDLDLEGPLGPAWLLPRMEIAYRQALFLRSLAESVGIHVSPDTDPLLAAIAGVAGDPPSEEFALREYLRDGLGRHISMRTVRGWIQIGVECRKILKHYAPSQSRTSIPQNPAAALPSLPTIDELDDAALSALLRQYLELLRALQTHEDAAQAETAAGDFLSALADYGHRYDLIAAMRVPLDEPFVVKLSERRSLKLSPIRNRGSQELVIADAQSNHLTLEVSDSNTRITNFEANDPSTGTPAFGAFESRKDPQNRAFYARGADRSYEVRLDFGLALLRRLQLVPYVASALLFALAVALFRAPTGDLRTLTIVSAPSALVASVLLTREPTTLGSRLRTTSSAVLFTCLVILLGSAGWAYLTGDVPSR